MKAFGAIKDLLQFKKTGLYTKVIDSFTGLTLIFLAGVVARFWNECVSCAFKKTVFSEQHTSFFEGLPHLHFFTFPAQ
jgi:hypothetical protein